MAFGAVQTMWIPIVFCDNALSTSSSMLASVAMIVLQVCSVGAGSASAAVASVMSLPKSESSPKAGLGFGAGFVSALSPSTRDSNERNSSLPKMSRMAASSTGWRL